MTNRFLVIDASSEWFGSILQFNEEGKLFNELAKEEVDIPLTSLQGISMEEYTSIRGMLESGDEEGLKQVMAKYV